MRITLLALALLVTTVTVLSLGGGAQTLQKLPPATATTNGPVVAELFTSQSCSSCPPAEKLFSELAERDDLIVLEWHVDYWDRLVHGRAGAWKDPYSDPDYTARQRQYNRALRGTGGAYTPQAVINGTSETVGHRASDIAQLVSSATHAMASLQVSRTADATRIEIGAFEVALTRPAEIFQLTLLPEQSTSVPRGENRGVHLFSRNVVLDAMQIGTYSGEAMSLDIDTPSAEYGCAIIIQEKRGNRLGPILGATYCS